MNPIELNAIRLLELMVKNDRELFENTWLQEHSGLAPRDINDAVDYLESIEAVEVFKYIGTAPFDFGDVELKSRGRYIYNEIITEREANEAKNQKLSIQLPARPLNPIGSPYGFTEDDWDIVALQKEDAQTIYVVMGMQFESSFYDNNTLSQNVQVIFQNAVQQYNVRHQDSRIELHFERLSAGLGEHLFNEIARNIIGADIAVFETSDLNPNVMLEIGVALTWGVRVLPIKSKEAPKPPSDISGQTWIDYEDSAARIIDSNFNKKLVKMIERAMAVKKRNP
jgi:hypothetical protein